VPVRRVRLLPLSEAAAGAEFDLCFKGAGEGASFVVIAAETSYKAGGCFLYMKERVTGGDDPISRVLVGVGSCRQIVQVIDLHDQRCGDSGVSRYGEMSQSAHMKSFSSVGRELAAVSGSRNEHRCSRIASAC